MDLKTCRPTDLAYVNGGVAKLHPFFEILEPNVVSSPPFLSLLQTLDFLKILRLVMFEGQSTIIPSTTCARSVL